MKLVLSETLKTGFVTTRPIYLSPHPAALATVHSKVASLLLCMYGLLLLLLSVGFYVASLFCGVVINGLYWLCQTSLSFFARTCCVTSAGLTQIRKQKKKRKNMDNKNKKTETQLK